MTATDELRRMLDERGVEWKAPNSCLRDEMTMWAAGGFDYEAFEVPEPDGTFLLTAANDDLTPEQVISATLGSCNCSNSEQTGTCRRVLYKPTGVLVCSECGAGIPKQLDKYCYLHYCPNCGRKVVDE